MKQPINYIIALYVVIIIFLITAGMIKHPKPEPQFNAIEAVGESVTQQMFMYCAEVVDQLPIDADDNDIHVVVERVSDAHHLTIQQRYYLHSLFFN